METYVKGQDRLRSEFMSLKQHSHLAMIYESIEDQMAGVLPFIQIGLEQGEHCFYAADENPIDEIVKRMNDFGIDTELCLNTGALAVLGKKDTYLRNDVFDPDEMIRFLDMAVKSARAAGFTGFRGVGEMSWSLDTTEGLERLIDYEAKLDREFHNLPMRVICQYNVNLFPPEVLLNVIKLHPQLIYKGKLCENVFYVPHDGHWTGDPQKLELDHKLEKLYAQSG